MSKTENIYDKVVFPTLVGVSVSGLMAFLAAVLLHDKELDKRAVWMQGVNEFKDETKELHVYIRDNMYTKSDAQRQYENLIFIIEKGDAARMAEVTAEGYNLYSLSSVLESETLNKKRDK